MLHGDLVDANVVWGADGPALVDWEFSRMGDPAEDLAYLVEVNGLPDAVAGAVLEGYALPGMAARMEVWRALAAADAGAWYRRRGHGRGGRAAAGPGAREGLSAAPRAAEPAVAARLVHGEKPRGSFSYLWLKRPPRGPGLACAHLGSLSAHSIAQGE